MNEPDLRKSLAKRLRRADVPPPLWQCLDEEGYLKDFWDELAVGISEMEALDELCDKALRLLRFYKAMSAHERTSNYTDEQAILDPESVVDPLETAVDPAVIKRNEAINAYRQRLAENNDAVRNFRSTVLGDKILSPVQATELLRSPLARYMTIKDFQQREIPVFGHQIQTLMQDTYIIDKKTVRPLEILASNSGLDTDPVEIATDPIDPNTSITEFIVRLYYPSGSKDGTVIKEVVTKTSVLGQLQKASEILAAATLWTESESTWFILTHETPSPVRLIHHEIPSKVKGPNLQLCQITMTIEAWVPPREVERYYREYQREFFTKDSYRPQNNKIELFNFVQEQKCVLERKDSTWKKIQQKWNEQYPELSYEDTRNFRRDYKRIEQKLLFPYRDSGEFGTSAHLFRNRYRVKYRWEK